MYIGLFMQFMLWRIKDMGVDRISAIPGLVPLETWLSPGWNSTPICAMCRMRSGDSFLDQE